MKINKDKILIAILAGGLSKRFGGGFKTSAEIQGKSILDIIVSKLKKQKINLIINANSNSILFKKKNIPIIKDINYGFQGPLAGIYASMLWSINNKKTDWLFTIPSDTPFLPENLIDEFLSILDDSTKILIARSNLKIHPIIAMWHTSLLESLENEINSKNRKIMNWVYKHKFKYVDFKFKDFDPFFNINTREDLKEANNFKAQNK